MEKTNIANQVSFWAHEGVLYCRFDDISKIAQCTARNYQQFLRVIHDLCRGVPMPLVVDLRQARGTLSADTAKILSARCQRIPLILGEAYVVQSLSIRLLVQSYVRLIHRKTPSATCTNMPDAKRFCDSLVAAASQKSRTNER